MILHMTVYESNVSVFFTAANSHVHSELCENNANFQLFLEIYPSKTDTNSMNTRKMQHTMLECKCMFVFVFCNFLGIFNFLWILHVVFSELFNLHVKNVKTLCDGIWKTKPKNWKFALMICNGQVAKSAHAKFTEICE